MKSRKPKSADQQPQGNVSPWSRITTTSTGSDSWHDFTATSRRVATWSEWQSRIDRIPCPTMSRIGQLASRAFDAARVSVPACAKPSLPIPTQTSPTGATSHAAKQPKPAIGLIHASHVNLYRKTWEDSSCPRPKYSRACCPQSSRKCRFDLWPSKEQAD